MTDPHPIPSLTNIGRLVLTTDAVAPELQSATTSNVALGLSTKAVVDVKERLKGLGGGARKEAFLTYLGYYLLNLYLFLTDTILILICKLGTNGQLRLTFIYVKSCYQRLLLDRSSLTSSSLTNGIL